MVGWWIVVYQLTPEELDAAKDRESRKPFVLATWEASIAGTEWLDQLADEGRAVQLLADGYPCRYAATARDVLPLIASGPPAHASPPVIGDDYVLPANWTGNVTFHADRIAACPADQVLTIDAWDQS